MIPDDISTSDLERRLASLQQQMATLLAAVEGARRLGALGVLAASVAHELNNILTPIQGYARSALARPDDHALGRRALQRASEGAARGASIARSILALAGEAVSPEVRRGDSACTEVASAVGEALDQSAMAVEASGARVEIAVPAGLATTLARFALVQVLQNLILNAAAAIARGGGGGEGSRGTIRIAARRGADVTGDQPGIEVEVQDSGPGIPASVRERLFKPFATAIARGSGELARDEGERGGVRLGGSGLGLSLCKSLVEAAGGRIEVESAVGEGTTFRVVLPASSEG